MSQHPFAARLLIVDDDPALLRSMTRSLRNITNLSVRTAGSADEALSVAAEWVPDLVLADVALEGEHDGFDLADPQSKESVSLCSPETHASARHRRGTVVGAEDERTKAHGA